MPSPNFGDRRGRAVDALILHYTGMANGEAALARLVDAAAEVSAHYLVWEDGRIDQLVAEDDRAWHAGHGSWAGEDDLNSLSIGIEIVNGGHEFGLPPYPPAQIEAVVALCADVARRRAIPAARILAHSDVAPARKEDPGEHFPWGALAAAGLVPALPPVALVHPPTTPADALARLGFAPPADADALAASLRAFQRRWRPDRITGTADDETLALLGVERGKTSRRTRSSPP